MLNKEENPLYSVPSGSKACSAIPSSRFGSAIVIAELWITDFKFQTSAPGVEAWSIFEQIAVYRLAAGGDFKAKQLMSTVKDTNEQPITKVSFTPALLQAPGSEDAARQ